jgi:hypothetical protein
LTALLALLSGTVAYIRGPYRRLMQLSRTLPTGERLKAAALVPVIRLVGDVAKMLGYPAGLWWRWRHRPPR